MRSVADTIERLKAPLTGILSAVIFVCLLAGFVLDGKYSKYPQLPDVKSGRTIAHSIKWHGDVYLTESEYAPYKWIWRVVGASAVLILVVQSAAVIAQRA
jgi:hypothetical protein